MSNVLLFVYPDKRYFELESEELAYSVGSAKGTKYFFPIFDRLIAARYRERGFRIFWLAFSVPIDPDRIDFDRLSSELTVFPEDTVISAGITLSEVNKDQYADPRFVRAQLPPGIVRLVLGGFHETCCVDKLAEYFYQQGIDTMVDTDLTNLMILRTRNGNTPPLHRRSFKPEDYLGERNLDKMRHVQTLWDEKPWHKQRRMYEAEAEELSDVEIVSLPVSSRRPTSIGSWYFSGTGRYAAYMINGSNYTYGHILVINQKFVVLNYNRVPAATKTFEESDPYTEMVDFPDFETAAEWLEEQTSKSPRQPPSPK